MTDVSSPIGKPAAAAWLAPPALQFVFWIGFYVVYQIARGVADRDVTTAFRNGLGDPDRAADGDALRARGPALRRLLATPDHADVVHVLALAVRRRRRDAALGLLPAPRPLRRLPQLDHRARTSSASSATSLVPTAPPRMFPEWGFVDTLAQYSSLNHDSGLIAFAANPYAAMPSLHAMDALIVGIVMFALSLAASGRRRSGCSGRSGSWFAVIGDRQPLLARRRRRVRARGPHRVRSHRVRGSLRLRRA